MSVNSGDISDDTLIDWKGVIFENRYIAIKKIGYGACSSVWMCWDTHKLLCVAIKIFNIDDYEHAEYELVFLKKIELLKSKYNVKLLGSFEKETDDGFHMCIVFELMKESLYSYRKQNTLNLEEIKIIARQTLEFLEQMNKSRYIHTDIKPENILVDSPSSYAQHLEKFAKSDKYQTLIANKKRQLISSKKHELKKISMIAIKEVILNEFNNICPCESEISDSSESSTDSASSVEPVYTDEIRLNKIKITDFNTCLDFNKPDYEIQTRYYRAPEIITHGYFSHKLDIWSLGCMLYELYTKEILLNPDEIDDIGDDRYHIYLIYKKIGVIDDEFWNDSKDKHIYLDRNNNLKFINSLTIEPFWISLINKFGESHELKTFIDFLFDCLVINPQYRKSASELLKHQFVSI